MGPGNGPPPPHTLMPYRAGSPRSEQQRPMHDNRMPSPKSAYPQHQPPYPHHPEPGMDNGGPMPPKGLMGPDMHRDERPPSVASKRMREWEDEPAMKKPASDENRSRMHDVTHRRPSTPPRDPYRRSPDAHRFEEQRRIEEQRAEDQRRAEEMRRADEQRHRNEGYHPSDAAHHPPAHAMPPSHLPPMQSGPTPMAGILHETPQPTPSSKEYSQEDRPRLEHAPAPVPPQMNEPERAARKMDVDEDYDDSGEEEKKVVPGGPTSGPASTSGDMKITTPTSVGMNGMMGSAPKPEST